MINFININKSEPYLKFNELYDHVGTDWQPTYLHVGLMICVITRKNHIQKRCTWKNKQVNTIKIRLAEGEERRCPKRPLRGPWARARRRGNVPRHARAAAGNERTRTRCAAVFAHSTE